MTQVATGRSESIAPTTAPTDGEIVRRNNGWLRPWLPGQSGNPGGIGGEYNRVRQLAKAHSMEAMQELIGLMSADDERVRFMACIAVLERGVGKPRDHSNEEQAMAQIDLSRLSVEEQAVLVSLLRRVCGIADR